jgi:uncharacterized glyoxalase superfamily protein PhnB
MPATALNVGNFTCSMTVNDLGKSMRFYMDGLGFTLARKFEHEGKMVGAMLNAGQANVALSQDDFAKGKDRPKGVAMSLYLETAGDVKEVATQLKGAGFAPLAEPAPLPWGPLGFTAVDPDGFKVIVANPE